MTGCGQIPYGPMVPDTSGCGIHPLVGEELTFGQERTAESHMALLQ
jgi:hypothetical protein